MPPTLSHPTWLAKARAARRANDAGAVMFIVAMTLAIIAAMGMYALNVAATEVKTAGYVRQQSQAYYLSEYGVMVALQEVFDRKTPLTNGSMAFLYYSQSRNKPDTNCTSLYGTPNTAGNLALACYVMHANQLVAQWDPLAMPPSGVVLDPYVTNANENSRGSEGNPVFPDFYVEITDPTQGPQIFGVSGGAPGQQPTCAIEFTFAAVGLTQLAPLSYPTQERLATRARVVGGQMLCQ
jgi:hypothetical protein